MGVTGLWTILDQEQTGRPINYKSLCGQRLAIDASIWLYQLSRVNLKSTHSRHAFIASGIFCRLAKLCHFGILPVFVFDGMPPLLKRQELKRRQQARSKSEVDVKKIAEKILKAKLKVMAAGGKIKMERLDDEEDDLFRLKPIADLVSEEEEYDSDQDEGDCIQDIDIHSPSFKQLPQDVQLELLYQLKEQLLYRTPSLPSSDALIDPRQFTNNQIEAIQKRYAISATIDRLKRGAIIGTADNRAKARKIASSEQKAFVLIKNQEHGYTFTPARQVDGNKLPDEEADKPNLDGSEDEFMAEFFGESEKTPIVNTNSEPSIPVIVEETIEETIEETNEKEDIIPRMVTVEKVKQTETASISEVEVKPEIAENFVEKGTSGPVLVEPISLEEVPKTVKDRSEIEAQTDVKINKETDSPTEVIVDLQRELDELQREHANKSLQTESLSSEYEQLFRDFLDAFGFPWMVAISEAEAQCANLFITGSVDGIITDDVDVFLFGGDNVYRHFFKSKTTPLVYRIEDLFKLNRDDLIILSLFLGGDYGPGLVGYGPKKAIALLHDEGKKSEHLSVHDRVSQLRLSLPHQPDIERALSSDIVDAYLNPAVETVHYDRLKWGVLDKKRLASLLKRQAGWNDLEIEKALTNLIKL